MVKLQSQTRIRAHDQFVPELYGDRKKAFKGQIVFYCKKSRQPLVILLARIFTLNYRIVPAASLVPARVAATSDKAALHAPGQPLPGYRQQTNQRQKVRQRPRKNQQY